MNGRIQVKNRGDIDADLLGELTPKGGYRIEDMALRKPIRNPFGPNSEMDWGI
jgi:hypothetical protein